MIITTKVLDYRGEPARWPLYQDASFISDEKLSRLRVAIRIAIEKELGMSPLSVTTDITATKA